MDDFVQDYSVYSIVGKGFRTWGQAAADRKWTRDCSVAYSLNSRNVARMGLQWHILHNMRF